MKNATTNRDSLSNGAPEVVVVGGGPAGAAAATLVAQGGRRVTLLERSPEPRFKVGESLMPATYWTLDRLGVLPAMRESAFPQKFSVQFYGPSGRASSPFYFFENDDHESSQTWQVLRRDFDRLLLDNARQHGVDVRLGTHVRRVLLESGSDGEPRATGVEVEDAGGRHEIPARVVVDASGQSALLARHLGLRQVDPRLRHASFFTHYEGARRDAGVDAGATLILHTEGRRSWFWFIPLPGDLVSVGVVGPVDHLVQGRQGEPQQVFDEELALCPALRERLGEARQVRPVVVAKDYSYRASRLAGDGWVLVGDAYGFLDPIYSTGVFLALKSGEMAADAILAALAADDTSAPKLGAFGDEFERGMEALGKLVLAFYDSRFSFARFLGERPHLRQSVIDLLVGNVYRKPVDELLTALDEWGVGEVTAPAEASG